MMTPQEWEAAEGRIELPDVLVGLDHVREDLEMIEEATTAHRQDTADPGRVTELHAISSDTMLAWAYVKRAHAALETLLRAQR